MDRWHLSWQELQNEPEWVTQDRLIVMEAEGIVAKEMRANSGH